MITLESQWIHTLHVLSYYTAVQEDYHFPDELQQQTENVQIHSYIKFRDNPILLWSFEMEILQMYPHYSWKSDPATLIHRYLPQKQLSIQRWAANNSGGTGNRGTQCMEGRCGHRSDHPYTFKIDGNALIQWWWLWECSQSYPNNACHIAKNPRNTHGP